MINAMTVLRRGYISREEMRKGGRGGVGKEIERKGEHRGRKETERKGGRGE